MLNYRLKNYFVILSLMLPVGTAVAQKLPERKPTLKENVAKGGSLVSVNTATYLPSTYTPQQLVQNVLMSTGAGCGAPQVSNVTITPNQPVTNTDRFWGYFKKETSTFPFAEGIVLTTGYAVKAGNTAQSGIMSDNNGGGSDPDLVAALNATNPINNAAVLEFDFVPTSTQMKFNYIFASEEWTGSFPCPPFSYDDAFVLLLKPNTPGSTYTNLAVLPNNAGPVNVPNIVPSSITCGPVNAQYFGGTNNNGTNYNGRTTPLTAQATVIPGQSYHIKMVVADARDSSYGSAVFLEAGSFDVGLEILGPNGQALPKTVNMCDNTPQTFVSSLQVPGATYQWLLNGTPIAGATTASYTASQPGIYCLQVNVPGNACPGEACVTVIGGTSPTVQNATLTQCYGAGNVNFNLIHAQPSISTTPGVTYAFYTTMADAQAQTNPIATPTSYSSAGNQTLYVVVTSSFCSKIAELQLVKAPQMTVSIAQPAAITCAVPQITLNASGSTVPSGSLYSWTGPGITGGANTATPTVNAAGVYTVTITKTYQPGNYVCTATGQITVTQDKVPPVATVTATKQKICAGETVVLTAAGGVNYVWANVPATGNTASVTPSSTTTYQVYAIGANGCQSTAAASVKVEVVPAISSAIPEISGALCEGDVLTLNAGAGPNYTYLWSTGETTQNIEVATPGIYSVTIDNGVCTKKYTTQVKAGNLPVIQSVDFQNNTLTVNATINTSNTLEYSINNGSTWQASNVFPNVPNNVTVTVQVRAKNTHCVDMVDYFTYNLASVITPNNDGRNDVLSFAGISSFPGFKAEIYDRYGKILWAGSKTAPIWDGRSQGKALPTTTYWYKASYQDPVSGRLIERNGWVLLKNRE